MNAVTKGGLLALISACCIAFVPNLAKLTYIQGAGVFDVLLYRGIIMILLLTPLLLIFKKLIDTSYLKSSLLSGVCFALMSFGYIGGVSYMDVGLVALIYFSHPVLIMLYYAFYEKRVLKNLEILAAISVFLGLYMTIGIDSYNVTLSGILCASLAAISCAAMIIINSKQINNKKSPININYKMVFVSTLLLTFPFLFINTDKPTPTDTSTIFLILTIGVLFTIGLLTFFYSFTYITPSRATFITLLQPVFIVIIDYSIFGTHLSLFQYFGGAIIVLAIIISELSKKVSISIRDISNKTA